MDKREKILAGLSKLTQGKVSTWQEEAEKRLVERSKTKKRSQQIAIKVLRTLREKSVTQKQLAKVLDVSPQQVNKWLKGSENFTLETIEKIETALDITLLEVKTNTSQSSGTVGNRIILRISLGLNEIKVERKSELVEGKPTKGKVIPFNRKSDWSPKKQYPYN